MKDYYDILGVPRDASQENIKRAYYLLTEQFHPNKTGGDETRFKEVVEAYRVLSSADTREEYDAKSVVQNADVSKVEKVISTDFDDAVDTGSQSSKPYMPVGSVILIVLAISATAFAIYVASSSGISSSNSNPTNSTASSTLTAAYTNTTANIRTCASLSCSSAGTYPPGTSVDISSYAVSDISQLPTWVSFTYPDSSGSNVTGYINRVVLSDTKTSTIAGGNQSVSGADIGTSADSSTAQYPAISNPSGNLTSSFIASVEPSVVEINCYSYNNTIESSGSGVSVTASGSSGTQNFVFTNYHVYTGGIVDGQVPTCYAVFPEPPNFTYNGYYGDYRLTLAGWRYNPSTYEDAAQFAIGASIYSPLNSIPVISDINSRFGIFNGKALCSTADVGDSVTIFGYPTSGNALGVSETVTTGIISGVLSGPIYKTNAAIDHGNSGGLAILNKSGCALGIPTLGASGLTAGIGYIQSYILATQQIKQGS